ncbi:MAG: HD domain-containing protein [Candidatus Caldarchaeum sp.]|uniref:HD domain-containing protein n=2 Tax=Caldiarchaeum subterraneum TaxID=311458 RepID=A0A7J3WCE7_CALS0
MRPMASRHETLEEHLIACLQFLKSHFIDLGYASHVAYSFGIDEKEAVKALNATVIFHDYGKAAHEYQRAASQRLSFPKHEYFSASAAYKSIKETVWRDECVLAIGWHHMAMRGPSLLDDFKTWKKFGAPEKATFSADFVETFRKIAEKTGLGDVIVNGPPQEIAMPEVCDTINHIAAKLSSHQTGTTFYRLTLKLLRPLLIVDNLAAAAKRGGVEKIFVKDLPDPEKIHRVKNVLRGLC